MNTPVSVLLQRAEKQMEIYAEQCMKDNNLPPDMMVFPLKALIAKLENEQAAEYSENLVSMTLEIQKMKKEKANDSSQKVQAESGAGTNG